jgi:hypothetical protein
MEGKAWQSGRKKMAALERTFNAEIRAAALHLSRASQAASKAGYAKRSAAVLEKLRELNPPLTCLEWRFPVPLEELGSEGQPFKKGRKPKAAPASG